MRAASASSHTLRNDASMASLLWLLNDTDTSSRTAAAGKYTSKHASKHASYTSDDYDERVGGRNESTRAETIARYLRSVLGDITHRRDESFTNHIIEQIWIIINRIRHRFGRQVMGNRNSSSSAARRHTHADTGTHPSGDEDEATASNVVSFNAGGTIVSVARSTILSAAPNSFLAAVVSGRWANPVDEYDEGGNIFQDVHPQCFASIIAYLRLKVMFMGATYVCASHHVVSF
jgi:hypothetical protein